MNMAVGQKTWPVATHGHWQHMVIGNTWPLATHGHWQHIVIGQKHCDRSERMANGLFQHSQGQRPWNPNEHRIFWPTAIFNAPDSTADLNMAVGQNKLMICPFLGRCPRLR